MLDAIAGFFALPGYLVVHRGEHAFFWLYPVCAIVAAFVVCARRSGLRGRRAIQAAAARVFDSRVFLHPSAITDYKLIAVNYCIGMVVLASGLVSTQAYARIGADALSHVLGASPAWRPDPLAQVVFTIVMFTAADLGNFLAHYLQHRVPALWELHKVHHSAEVLTPFTALRVHPLAEIFGGQVIALSVSGPAAVFLWAYDGPVAEVTVLGANALSFLWRTVLLNHLQHSHVWLMYPRFVREVFSSPALHLIHHSADPRHHGKNLGFSFTLWDRLAGTFHQPDDSDRRGLRLGVEPHELNELRTTGQLYWTPLRNILFAKLRTPATLERETETA